MTKKTIKTNPYKWVNVGECIRYHTGMKRYEVCVIFGTKRHAATFISLPDARDQRSAWYRLRDRTPRAIETRNPDHKPEIGRNNELLRMPWILTNTENLLNA